MDAAPVTTYPGPVRWLPPPRRIMIRAANWIGDAVMTTPAVRGIRRSHPGARITLLAKPWVAPVFACSPHIDEIMIYDAAGRHAGPRGRWQLVRDIRLKAFDTAVLFQNAFEAALLSWAGGIPRRVGYATDGRAPLLTHRIWNVGAYKRRHMIDYYLGILKASGMVTDGRRPALFISGDERAQAEGMLHRMGCGDPAHWIGLNPGATGGSAKRWFPERFAAVCRRLVRETGAVPLIFGGPADAPLGRWMADAIGPPAVNLCGRTDLRTAMALIDRCRVFITNDSGLMHVAAAVDTPQVAVIGSTDHVRTGPSNPHSVIVRADGACHMAPCMKTECPIDHRCMAAVGVDAVTDRALRLMGEPGGGPS